MFHVEYSGSLIAPILNVNNEASREKWFAMFACVFVTMLAVMLLYRQ
jgi:hypothetical protein